MNPMMMKKIQKMQKDMLKAQKGTNINKKVVKYIEIYIFKLLLFILTDDSICFSTLRTRDRKDKNPAGSRINPNL